MSSRFTMIVAVHLILQKGDQVLLARRYGTGYEDGKYSLPAGHVEQDESCLAAMIREAKEELGIVIKESDLKLVHVMHRRSDRESTDLFFGCQSWLGEPKINEPDKCDDILWNSVETLPVNTIGYIRQALLCTQHHQPYSELGF